MRKTVATSDALLSKATHDRSYNADDRIELVRIVSRSEFTNRCRLPVKSTRRGPNCETHLRRVLPRIAARIGMERKRASKHACASYPIMGRRAHFWNGLTSCGPRRRHPIGMASGITPKSRRAR
jgi:hypothetical protein